MSDSTLSLPAPAASPARRSAPPARLAVGLVAAAMLLAAAWQIRASFGHMLWLDELYTTTLIDAPSLGHVVDGAVRGVDGNPPLYLSLAWALTRAIPAAPEAVLRPLNLLLLAATAAVLYRIGRRVASPLAVLSALALLPAVDGMVDYALVEVRTYALYLFLVAATLDAALRAVDRPTAGRAAALAGAGVLAAASHSFGGFYALATIGPAAAACLLARDRRGAAALALAAVPTLLALAAWIAISFPAQTAVATPYGWIPRPDLATLLDALTGSLPLTLALGLGLALVVRPKRMIHPFAPVGPRDPRWCSDLEHSEGESSERVAARATARLDLRRGSAGRRDAAALWAALLAYAGLTVAGWIGSQAITPFFVPRYFIPNVLIAALLLVPAAEAARRGVRPAFAAGGAVLCVVLGLAGLVRDDAGGPIPCRGADGRFLEAEAARGGLPVVAESPHAWLPRSRYAPGQTTLYPLDWRVVLDWPDRARNNAMDYHIMEILRGWAAPGTALAGNVLATEEILARNGRFLVLDEARRAWFDALRARVPVSATLVAEGPGCRLWEVSRAENR